MVHRLLPEVPGANGQGKTEDECLEDLSKAISMILEDRRSVPDIG